MTHIAPSFLCLVRSVVMLCFIVALTGCSTHQPVNAAPGSAGAISEHSDSDMRPDRLLAECKSLKSGGTYRLSNGPEDHEVTFFLDRDSRDSIRKLQGLMGSFEFILSKKNAHAALDPEADSSSLWIAISPADGGSDLRLILSGTSIITSDNVNDWHWSGGSSVMYTSVIEALAPTEAERHVERVKAGAGVGDDAPPKAVE